MSDKRWLLALLGAARSALAWLQWQAGRLWLRLEIRRMERGLQRKAEVYP